MKKLLAILFSVLFFLPTAKGQKKLHSKKTESFVYLNAIPAKFLPLTIEENQKIYTGQIHKIAILRGCPEPIKKPRAVNWRNKIRNSLLLMEFFGSPNYLYLQQLHK